METFPRNWPFVREFTGPGEFPTQRPVTRSFDVYFDLRLNKRLSKQPWGWWFETQSMSLWRHCNVITLADTGDQDDDSQVTAAGTNPPLPPRRRRQAPSHSSQVSTRSSTIFLQIMSAILNDVSELSRQHCGCRWHIIIKCQGICIHSDEKVTGL